MLPSFTVVIPTYNRAEDLSTTLQAMRALDPGVEWEVVVIDDGSTDDTDRAIKAFDDLPLRYLPQANAGVSAARNRGAEVATGDLVVFLDTADEPHPDWLTTFASLTDAYATDITFVGARALRADGSEKHVRPVTLGPFFGRFRANFTPGCFAIRPQLFAHVGGYDTALRYSEGTELGMRVAFELEGHHERAVSTPTPHLTWNIPAGSSHAGSDQNRWESAVYVLDKHRDRFALHRRPRSTYERLGGLAAARLGEHAEARRLLWAAARDHPTDWRSWARAAGAISPAVQRRVWSR